jgi:hypothetical protein
VEKIKFSCPSKESNLHSLILQPVAESIRTDIKGIKISEHKRGKFQYIPASSGLIRVSLKTAAVCTERAIRA